jgi:hypothetical protein
VSLTPSAVRSPRRGPRIQKPCNGIDDLPFREWLLNQNTARDAIGPMFGATIRSNANDRNIREDFACMPGYVPSVWAWPKPYVDYQCAIGELAIIQGCEGTFAALANVRNKPCLLQGAGNEHCDEQFIFDDQHGKFFTHARSHQCGLNDHQCPIRMAVPRRDALRPSTTGWAHFCHFSVVGRAIAKRSMSGRRFEAQERQ